MVANAIFWMDYMSELKNSADELAIFALSYMCRRAVSGILSDGNRVGHSATFVARKSYYNEEYSVYLCGRASLLSLTAVRQFASYSVQCMFGAIAEFGYNGVGVRPDNGD